MESCARFTGLQGKLSQLLASPPGVGFGEPLNSPELVSALIHSWRHTPSELWDRFLSSTPCHTRSSLRLTYFPTLFSFGAASDHVWGSQP
ncbi:uncharacterized protein VTP21DRAFT_5262 [Calcarisporiella thermophila]|uniref:uncharacterized protein n=1 Tax=Calcarisporiella thermophila TaxID=911321 RepID=UPI003742C18B